MGVTSRMKLILKPAACSALSADSRPEPGPLTYTSTLRIPCSWAFLAQSSAAIWAAKGVLFLEPLNPLQPEVDQATTFPAVSVIVIMVLLKVAWMCATPLGIFLRSFFFLTTFRAGLAIIPPVYY